MQLVSVEKTESPLLPGFLRIAGTVRFDDGTSQTIWFDVPADQAPYLNEQGDPWAALLAPEAVYRGEDLRLDLPVDPTLLDNLRGLQRLWHSWYRFARAVEIVAPVGYYPVVATETAQFFSGGVDSFSTLLRGQSRSDYPAVAPTSCLLTLWGFDIALEKPEAFAVVRGQTEDTARAFGMTCIPIATNMSTLQVNKRRFGSLGHGAVMAAAGLLLAGRFQNLIIAASADLGHLVPWGSHPTGDPLLSTSQTRIIHDGANFTRVEKTELIGTSPLALSRLRVCWAGRDASNCSRCAKCLRTMASLDLLGLREQATSFDWSDYSLKRVAGAYLPSPIYMQLTRDVRDDARKRGRDDIVRAINTSLRRSLIKRYTVVGLAQRFWAMVKKVSFLKQLASPLHRILKRVLMSQ